MKWFSKPKYQVLSTSAERADAPGDLWIKCKSCSQMIYKEEWRENLKVCPTCGYHGRMNWKDRVDLLLDTKSFRETDREMDSHNPLDFEGYDDRLKKTVGKTGMKEAVVTGKGKIKKMALVFTVLDFQFLGASMSNTVGEKVTRSIDRAAEEKIPLLICSSSGGARMQEGILSLMQMAKTSAALKHLSEQSVPYISLITDPTTGGVSASFATLGDINIAEPGALIGFAGPRVIENTIRQKLPPGFQRAEFLLEHGFVDCICERQKLKDTIADYLTLLYYH